MPSYTYTYFSEPNSERRFLDDLQNLLELHGFDGKLYQDICLTLSEAFTNALEHGNRFDPGKEITVLLRINKMGLSADIIDEGCCGMQQVATKSSPDPLSESGRGVDLMHHYASDVRFAETPTGGLKVTVSFKKEQRIENEMSNTRGGVHGNRQKG